MYTYILWIMLAYLALYFIRVVKGPSIWDRLIGINLISTKIIVIIIVFASINGTSFLLDFAVIYALFGFVGTIFIAQFLLERERKRRI